MRTIKILSILLFVGLALTACKKDDDGANGGGSNEVGTFTVNIDGAAFSGDVVALANEVTANGATTIRLQASDAQGRAFLILINGYDGTGTYEFSTANTITNVATYTEANITNPQDSKSWAAPYENSGVAGEINFSEKTATTIKGTFSFEGKEQNGTSIKSFTNGQFNLEFQ